jgi:hypothetical protein
MSSEIKEVQTTLGAGSVFNIADAVTTFASKVSSWEGTAANLCELLGVNVEPRSLSAILRKTDFRGRVAVDFSRRHGTRLIRVAESHTAHKREEFCVTPTPTPPSGAAKIKEGKRAFFTWKYGRIEELSEEEKIEYNRLQRNGTHKHHFRHCQLCGQGGEGVIQYRKFSDGNASLLCKECAEKYVRNEKELKKRGV